MGPTPHISCDTHNFMLRNEQDVGEGLELTAHDDGGITIATALRDSDFCDATQASLTRDQALELFAWLERALHAASRP